METEAIGNRGWLVDLVHSIGEKLALCDHLAEELDNPTVRALYNDIVEERRKEMRILANSVPNCRPEYWCGFKHACKSWVLAMECYDALPNDENLNVAQYSGKILAGVMSLFLDLEFKFCERCVYDALLLGFDAQNNKERSLDGQDEKR